MTRTEYEEGKRLLASLEDNRSFGNRDSMRAWLLVDDDSEHLTTLPARFEIDKESPRVELRVERVTE